MQMHKSERNIVYLRGFALSGKSVEVLEESLRNIEKTVEEIAQVLFKGNGHSLTSRTALLERANAEQANDLDTIRIGINDVKARMMVTETKLDRFDETHKTGDSKIWSLVTIGASLLVTILFQLYLRSHQ